MKKRHKQGRRRRNREKLMTRLFRWYRRKHICVYLCDDCSKPYVVKPDGIEIEQFISGSSVARVFMEQGFSRTNFHVEFTCMRVQQDKLVQVPLFRQEHMEDVRKVAAMAYRFVQLQKSAARNGKQPIRRQVSKG